MSSSSNPGKSSRQEVSSWSCPQCTFVNHICLPRCAACQYEFEARNGLNGLLHKIKLPHFSINGALERLDSTLDLVAKSLTPRSGQNCYFYPPPTHSNFDDGQLQSATWTCPICAQPNPFARKHCVACTYENENAIDVTSSYWTCSNARCGLKQPSAPPNLRCPLCRTKSNWQRMVSSRSMPHLNNITVADEAVPEQHLSSLPIEEDRRLENTEYYREIVQICRHSRQHFIDDSFPHSARSIGSLDQLEKQNLSIIWLRPEQIVTKDGRMTRWSVFNDPQPTDIEQGFLGNCWFLSALAVVAERPDILERLFLTKQYNSVGVYEMRLCIDGIWQNVIVDDLFPCHKRGRAMVFGVGRKNQLWVSLVEKALAKVYGNYAVLRAGRTVEGLSTLTGAPTQSIDLEHTELGPEARQSAMDLCWAQLLSAREARFIMGCSCGAGKRPVDEAEYRRLGLMTQHAYSLLDVKQTSTGHRVVQLRNPWGSFVWLGQFSQGWPGWTPQLHRELASEANRWPGTFWMPFEQFAHFFDTVDIAQIHHRSWTTTRYQLDIGWEKGKTRMVRMTVTEPTELCVVLHQRHARTSLDQVDIMVLVHRQDPSRGDVFPGELVCRSPRKIQPSVRTEDRFFRPGDYLLCVHSFTKFGDATLPGALAIHSSKTVFSELLSVPLETQQQSMCALVLQEGTVHEPFPGVISRYLTHDFAGLALMVDNLNRGSCVQTLSDCQNSTNVLSTRASLLTADSVPPLHRQIVTVLTHFEPSQAFMVTHSHRHQLVTHPQLRDFAPAAEFAGAQNYPLLVGPAVGALHSPSPLFT